MATTLIGVAALALMIFVLGFVTGVASSYGYVKQELNVISQKETEKMEDGPKYGFAAKM